MIPPQLWQQIQQLAQAAGQSVQNWIASNPDKIKELIKLAALHLSHHYDEYKKELDDWVKKNF